MDGMRLRFLLITLSSLLIFGACSSDTYDFIITSSDPDAVNIENIVTPNDPDNHVHSELKQPIDKDFLILFYINGDTPFNDYAFYQMAQIGKGLRQFLLPLGGNGHNQGIHQAQRGHQGVYQRYHIALGNQHMVGTLTKRRHDVICNADHRGTGTAAVPGTFDGGRGIPGKGKRNNSILCIHTHDFFKHLSGAHTRHHMDIVEHVI